LCCAACNFTHFPPRFPQIKPAAVWKTPTCPLQSAEQKKRPAKPGACQKRGMEDTA
jgi:hypothetical protein